MKCVCSYCLTPMKDKEPLTDLRVSHGVCVACFEKYVASELLKIDPTSLPDSATPVLVLNGEGRVMGVNASAEIMMGHPLSPGSLGGDYMDCMIAPDGCGRTEACASCTVRLAVMAAMSGNTHTNLPVFLRREDGTFKLTITTRKMGDLVQVTVHKVEPVEG